jgi:predicted TIM-barrel fold metal-dependent hydrolase
MYTGFNRAVQDTLSRRMEVHRQWQRGFVAQPIESPLSAVGVRIYNRWLADFLSVEPERHVGLMQLPIWDIDATIAELHWGREHGLRGVNFPAPRQGLVPYNDPSYEPMWSALEELDLALATHAGAGDIPLGISGPAGYQLLAIETAWLGRRAVWQMIFSGVFERHPNLRLVLAEQGVQWIPEMLREMDSLYAFGPMASMREFIPEPPSTYWYRNCFIAASFAARFEVEQRHLIGGADKIMWGSDFPHMEGTWPHTLASLRTTFHDLPEDEVRRMLGGSAIDVFGFDAAALDKVAARIGPRPEDLDQPAGEIPVFPGMGFRELGLWS